MFKVVHKESGKVYTVYAARIGDNGCTMFLIWDYRWEWDDADDYYLVNERWLGR